MYSINNLRRTDSNGYIIVYIPDHHKSMKSGVYQGYVYEHVLVAENMLGRRLLEGEVVHHLDCNRSNNSPDNLLVLSNTMHSKLHGWLNKYILHPKEQHSLRLQMGCVRCAFCQFPIFPDQKYCSHECSHKSNRVIERPCKEELLEKVWSRPTSHIAKEYGVSDKAIEKWCKSMDIEKPTRGYWSKHKKHTE